MIKVSRGHPEPSTLTAARDAALPALRPHGPATRRDLPCTYKVAHRALWEAQHYKCAYCECREQSKRNDVEHFRPASRYWWLAFTWDNLLFSCRNCNQSPAKLDKFPLAEGSVHLEAEQLPPGGEFPLLLDPASESGVEHIEFVEDLQRRCWLPRARNGSRRGNETIRVCCLDRPDLTELYSFHVKRNVMPDVDDLLAALASSDAVGVRAAWARFLRRHLDRAQIFVGLARDVLLSRVSRDEMERFQLTLPDL